MALINNIQAHIDSTKQAVDSIQRLRDDSLIWDAFYKGFTYRFCWSSNSLEGNTLSLDETIAVVDFDEVSAGHTFSEYQDAKNLYRAIRESLSAEYAEITEEWIQRANGIVCSRGGGGYRDVDVFVGHGVEAVYYPPSYPEVPKLMREFAGRASQCRIGDFCFAVNCIAEQHILFERIHPFTDGNGRTGRLILNQMLLNNGLLPVTIKDASKYRQAFRAYDRNRDMSMLVYLVCGALEESAQSLMDCDKKRELDRSRFNPA